MNHYSHSVGSRLNSSLSFLQTISLTPGVGSRMKGDVDDDCDSKLFGDASLSLKASLGETAVDLAFAPAGVYLFTF